MGELDREGAANALDLAVMVAHLLLNRTSVQSDRDVAKIMLEEIAWLREELGLGEERTCAGCGSTWTETSSVHRRVCEPTEEDVEDL